MRIKILLCFLLFFVSLYSQKSIEIDSLFESSELLENLTYYYDNENNKSISTIMDIKFKCFNKSFPGVKNAKFWFKFSLFNKASSIEKVILKIKSSTISSFKLYEILDNDLNDLYSMGSSLKKSIDIPISLEPNKKENYIIEVFFKRSVYFPAKIVSLKEDDSIKTKLIIYDALFYGFSLVVLIVNFLFYLNTRKKFFIYYCFLLVSILVSLMNSQGLLYYIFSYHNINVKIYLVIIVNFFTILAYMLFTINALELDKFYPKNKVIKITILISFILFSILFFFTNNIFWYSILKIIYFLAIIIFWIYGVLLFNKLIYARFLILGYTVLLVSQILFMLSLNFGITEIGFTVQYYKIGCIIEMLVFLYAISYRHKVVQENKESIEITCEKITKNIKVLEEELALQKNKEKLDFINQVDMFREAYNLNERELQVLKGNLKGLKNKEIADLIFLSEASIKNYNRRLFEKTKTKNKIQLMNLFNQIEF